MQGRIGVSPLYSKITREMEGGGSGGGRGWGRGWRAGGVSGGERQARMRALSGSYIGRSERDCGIADPGDLDLPLSRRTGSPTVIGSSASIMARPTAPPRVWP